MANIYKGHSHEFEELALLSDAGGMANVYLAAEVGKPDHKVAIKVPKTGLPQHVADLFLREAEAAARVASLYVVALEDWGETPPFIAYEYMASGTLGREIQRRQQARQPWSLTELIELYRTLVEGMVAINARVIHRDLKPDNVYLDADLPRISDFGISKYVSETTRTLTFKGAGTAAYMAPETFRFDSTDWKADQYSLGVVFYELATLDTPFAGDWDVLEKAHLFQMPARVTTKRGNLPERVASLIGRMLEKKTDKRFGSWDEVLAEIEAIASGALAAEAPTGEDPALHGAAAALGTAKARELAAQERKEDIDRRTREQADILDFWAAEFFGKVTAKTEALNASLGGEAFQIRVDARVRVPGRTIGPHRCYVAFLNGSLTIELHHAPLDNQHSALARGVADCRTWGRLCVTNLLLLPDDSPYGGWNEVDMQMSIPGQPESRRGGEYDHLGNLVLAKSWIFLDEQRELKNVFSGLNYQESDLDFDNLLDQLFGVLSEDGHNEKPQEQPRNAMGGFRPLRL